MQAKVAVVGAGSWGSTIASVIARNVPVSLWARRPEVAAEINAWRTNRRYLGSRQLHPSIEASPSLPEVVAGADVVVMAVPAHSFRDTLACLVPALGPEVPVVSLAKGLEQGTNMRMTEIVAQIAEGRPAAVLTGPNLAKEILDGHAAAAVVAAADHSVAERLQAVLATDLYRVYTNTDVVGCEVAGALKNVIALAAGMAHGLGTGDNTLAALITRGLSELTRLGVAMGGQRATFAGLAGMGDLVVTCISHQSRNRHVGIELGRGRRLPDVLAEMDQVAEGVWTVPVARELAAAYAVEMPIVDQMHAVLVHGLAPAEAYRDLLQRKAGREVRDG